MGLLQPHRFHTDDGLTPEKKDWSKGTYVKQWLNHEASKENGKFELTWLMKHILRHVLARQLHSKAYEIFEEKGQAHHENNEAFHFLGIKII